MPNGAKCLTARNAERREMPNGAKCRRALVIPTERSDRGICPNGKSDRPSSGTPDPSPRFARCRDDDAYSAAVRSLREMPDTPVFFLNATRDVTMTGTRHGVGPREADEPSRGSQQRNSGPLGYAPNLLPTSSSSPCLVRQCPALSAVKALLVFTAVIRRS